MATHHPEAVIGIDFAIAIRPLFCTLDQTVAEMLRRTIFCGLSLNLHICRPDSLRHRGGKAS